TNIPNFNETGDVRRRFRDFVAFRTDLTHEFPGRAFPDVPPKATVQFSKSAQLIEQRRLLFAKFLKEVAADTYIHTRSKALRRFLQDELYKPAEEATIIGKVSEMINIFDLTKQADDTDA
ncbi:hypothetical protein HDU99_010486, partial [Rhizoclosmatium hyalinum]